MQDVLFDFEHEKMPPAVVVATGLLFALFGLGIAYRVLSAVVL